MSCYLQEGLANLCLIGSATTISKAKIEMSMPRKRGAAAAGYDTAYKTFLNRASPVTDTSLAKSLCYRSHAQVSPAISLPSPSVCHTKKGSLAELM